MRHPLIQRLKENVGFGVIPPRNYEDQVRLHLVVCELELGQTQYLKLGLSLL